MLGDPIPTELLRVDPRQRAQPRMYSEPTEPVECENRRPGELFRMAERRFLCADAWPRGDERGHRHASRRFLFRLRRRIAVSAARCPRRTGSPAVDRHRFAADRVRPAGRATNCWCSIRRGRSRSCSCIATMCRSAEPAVQVAADAVLEFAIPWKSLAVSQDDPVHLYLELIAAGTTDGTNAARRDVSKPSFPRPITNCDVAGLIGWSSPAVTW